MRTTRLFAPGFPDGEFHPFVSAYYYRLWQGFQMPFHTHEDLEIMYNISGSCRIQLLADHPTPTEFTLKKGEFILLNAANRHRLIVEEQNPCRMLNLEFRFVQSRKMFPSLKQLAEQDEALAALLSVPHSYIVLRDSDEVYHLLKNLVLELDCSRTDSGIMVQLMISQLLIRIARLHQEAQSGAIQMADFYIKQIVEFLHHNYDQPIQIKDVASAVNLHPGYVQRVFKTGTGKTIIDYLTELRMEKAKMLLLQTDVPIVDISDYVGVASRQYFHTLFKKHSGLTPTEYRSSRNAYYHFPKIDREDF